MLGYQGNHVLAASVRALAIDPRVVIDSDRKFTGSVTRSFGIYKRLAITPKRITSLQAAADANENISIHYTDQDGQQFTLRLDAKR